MSRLVEYVNPHPHTVQITGPNKEIHRIPKYAKVVLSDWYIDRYTPKFLRVARILSDQGLPNRSNGVSVQTTRPYVLGAQVAVRAQKIKNSEHRIIKATEGIRNIVDGVRSTRSQRKELISRGRIVGRTIPNASKIYNQVVQDVFIAISNNIGVGIMSYNRLGPLQRLVDSIRKYTDLSRTTIFISDDGSTDPSLRQWLSTQDDMVVLNNHDNLGVAGNSNRLLNCLKRFKHKIILNDDVEILSNGWEKFYADVMAKTGLHHLCFRQDGLCGASRGEGRKSVINNVLVQTIGEKPHGAVMAFDDVAFDKVGYFDSQLGHYGMEHVDWSNRVGLSGIQPSGFHDASGSDKFFIIHKEQSAATNRGAHLKENRALYNQLQNDRSRILVQCAPQSNVQSISVIIPIRDVGRTGSANTVISCLKAQKFPDIEIIVVEQDSDRRFDFKPSNPIKYVFVGNSKPNQEFNKSKAFNKGVLISNHNKIIMHDADIIIQANYIRTIFGLLDAYESCHIGARVLYIDTTSTTKLAQTGKIGKDYTCERAVGYFEGGSIACRKDTFFKVGGFNEAFEGYGCEDCDFFTRLKDHSRFYSQRSIDMLHMWHSRVSGWDRRHKINKDLIASIGKTMKGKVYINHLVAQMQNKYPESKAFYG
jgi:GT2 family glycosyltransferase